MSNKLNKWISTAITRGHVLHVQMKPHMKMKWKCPIQCQQYSEECRIQERCEQLWNYSIQLSSQLNINLQDKGWYMVRTNVVMKQKIGSSLSSTTGTIHSQFTLSGGINNKKNWIIEILLSHTSSTSCSLVKIPHEYTYVSTSPNNKGWGWGREQLH